jgi:hypothetical protein
MCRSNRLTRRKARPKGRRTQSPILAATNWGLRCFYTNQYVVRTARAVSTRKQPLSPPPKSCRTDWAFESKTITDSVGCMPLLHTSEGRLGAIVFINYENVTVYSTSIPSLLRELQPFATPLKRLQASPPLFRSRLPQTQCTLPPEPPSRADWFERTRP